MSDFVAATRALDELEKIQVELATVTKRTDASRRADLVAWRRVLATRIVAVGQCAEPLFADAPDDRAEFRRLYAAMRSAAAMHQAEWPAVRLDEPDNQYSRSTTTVRIANHAFVDWLRAWLQSAKR